MTRAIVFAVVAVVVVVWAGTFLVAQSEKPIVAPLPEAAPVTAVEESKPVQSLPPASPALEAPSPQPAPLLAAPVPDVPIPAARTVALAEPPASDVIPTGTLSPLQRRFVELSAKMARMLKDDALQRAVSELEREVEGLSAWSRVEEASKILREVSDQHPQTKAAQAAQSALNAINAAHEPTPDPISRERVGEGIGRQSTPFGSDRSEPTLPGTR